jgi:hypothetical protein
MNQNSETKDQKNPSTLQLNNRIRKLPAAVQKRKEEGTKRAQENVTTQKTENKE